MEVLGKGSKSMLDGDDVHRTKNTVLDSLIDSLPFQLTIPGTECCGPGTRIDENNLAKPRNKLDEACMAHDLAYARNDDDRRKADRILADKAFTRVFAAQAEPDERTAALITACCMIGKITFENCFERITEGIRKISLIRCKKNLRSCKQSKKKNVKKIACKNKSQKHAE